MKGLVPESLSKVKDSITEALLSVLESDLNKQGQYNRHNNLDNQGSPDSVSDNKLVGLGSWLDKSNKNTIAWFANKNY